jgi:hypothetical protein
MQEMQPKVSATDFTYAMFQTLLANTFAIGAENAEKLAFGIAPAFRVGSEKVDNLFLTDAQLAEKRRANQSSILKSNKKKDPDEKGVDELAFDDKIKATSFLNTVLAPIKDITAPPIQRDLINFSKNVLGAQERNSYNPVERLVADNLLFEALVNPFIPQARLPLAYDAFGLPFKEKTSVPQIIRALSFDMIYPNDNFEEDVLSKQKSPLYTLMTDKRIKAAFTGAYESDVMPEMIDKPLDAVVSEEERMVVDQHIKLLMSQRILEKYETLDSKEGMEFYKAYKKTADNAKSYVLLGLKRNPKTIEQLRKENEAMIKEIIAEQQKMMKE